MAAITLSMPTAMQTALRRCALSMKKPMSEVVSVAMLEFITRHGLVNGGEWLIRPDASHPWGAASNECAMEAKRLGWEIEYLANGHGT